MSLNSWYMETCWVVPLKQSVHRSEFISASSSERQRMLTVTLELREVHCPSDWIFYQSPSHLRFNSAIVDLGFASITLALRLMAEPKLSGVEISPVPKRYLTYIRLSGYWTLFPLGMIVPGMIFPGISETLCYQGNGNYLHWMVKKKSSFGRASQTQQNENRVNKQEGDVQRLFTIY